MLDAGIRIWSVRKLLLLWGSSPVLFIVSVALATALHWRLHVIRPVTQFDEAEERQPNINLFKVSIDQSFCYLSSTPMAVFTQDIYLCLNSSPAISNSRI